MTRAMDEIPIRGDGAKWGVSDFYDEVRAEIDKRLKKGRRHRWTTGWYAVKKEIQSGRITCEGGQLRCEASVSDDLDTPGRGECVIPFTTDWDKIAAALDRACDEACSDQKDNRVYAGYAISKRCRPKGFRYTGDWWVETYLMPVGIGCEMDEPPGDNYHSWGWQGEDERMPEAVRRRLEKWIIRHAHGATAQTQFTVSGYTARPFSYD